jgi:hypothetical protein
MRVLVSRSRCFVPNILVVVLLLLSQVHESRSEEWKPKIDDKSASALFEIAHDIEVSAPSQFPKPTRLLNDTTRTVEIIVEPAFGKHRPDKDVVMVSRPIPRR